MPASVSKSRVQVVAGWLREVLLYGQVLGWVRGGVTWLRWRVLGQRFEVTVRVPGLLGPVALRAHETDVLVFKKIFLDAEYALPFAAAPGTIADLGANTGLATLFLHRAFPQAVIVAVEPDAGNFALLRRNVAGLPMVRCLQAAVWREDGEIALVDPGLGAWGMQVGELVTWKAAVAEADGVGAGGAGAVAGGVGAGGAGRVRAISMGSLLGEFAEGRIDLLKVDVEGAEREVFEGSAGWIGQIGAIVIELHDRYKPGCSRAFFNAVGALPCERWVGENVFVWRE